MTKPKFQHQRNLAKKHKKLIAEQLAWANSQIVAYEAFYGMSSEEMREKIKSGEVYVQNPCSWLMLLEAKDRYLGGRVS